MKECPECEGSITDFWHCQKCDEPVEICIECKAVFRGCLCGHTETGEEFREEDVD